MICYVFHAKEEAHFISLSDLDVHNNSFLYLINSKINQNWINFYFQVMPRSTSAHAIVNAGFMYQLSNNCTVLTSRIVFGGLSPSFTRAYKTEQYLADKQLFQNETLQSALKILENEMVIKDNPPAASVEFRQKLALGLFYKVWK